MDKSQNESQTKKVTTQNKGIVSNQVKYGCLFAMFIIVIIFVSFVFGPSEFKYSGNVLDHKTAIIDGNTEFDVTLKLRGWDAGETDMYSVILDMQTIMKHELKEGSQEKYIGFHIVGDAGGAKDDYGNTKPIHIIDAFDIRYSMEDIKKINWDHISPFRLLNLGQVDRITPAGAEVAREYCAKDREYSQVFCANF